MTDRLSAIQDRLDPAWRWDGIAKEDIRWLVAEVIRLREVEQAAREIAAKDYLGIDSEFEVCNYCEVDFLTVRVEEEREAEHRPDCPVLRFRAALAKSQEVAP